VRQGERFEYSSVRNGFAVGATVTADLPQRGQWLVPTIVRYELAKWLTRQAGEDKADQVIAFSKTCVIADLDTAIALSVADVCVPRKLATPDAIVYATAWVHGADLLTCDRQFDGLREVRFVPKSTG
jgi:predicted nucleic acid-binding protein